MCAKGFIGFQRLFELIDQRAQPFRERRNRYMQRVYEWQQDVMRNGGSGNEYPHEAQIAFAELDREERKALASLYSDQVPMMAGAKTDIVERMDGIYAQIAPVVEELRDFEANERKAAARCGHQPPPSVLPESDSLTDNGLRIWRARVARVTEVPQPARPKRPGVFSALVLD